MTISSVQKAHDALLALKPPTAVHEDCPLCAGENFADQEVAHVAEDVTAPALAGNVYSEAQHFSLVKSAVEKETSSLTTEKSELQSRVDTLESEKADLATQLSEAKSQLDILESAKVTAEAAAEEAKKSFEDFKLDLEKKADAKKKKAERSERVKAANENLNDAYFTDERTSRWAEMSDEDFNSLVTEMTEFAAAKAAEKPATTTEAAKETAAFSGGTTPTSTTEAGNTSVLGQFFAAQFGERTGTHS